MTELHSTTALVLQAIKAFWAEEGYSPSIRDIMDEVGITSTSIATIICSGWSGRASSSGRLGWRVRML